MRYDGPRVDATLSGSFGPPDGPTLVGMAKKWHSRGSHALSSGVAIATLVTAGIAAASQGGAVGAIGSRAHSGDAQAETRVVSRSSASRTGGLGDGTVVGDGSPSAGATGDAAVRDGSMPRIPGSCEDAMASVRDSPPAQGDNPGIRQAIAVVSANCADAPQAQGLLTALEHLLPDHGAGAPGNGGNGGKGHPDRGGLGSGQGGGSGTGGGPGNGGGPGSGRGGGTGTGTGGTGGGSGGGPGT